MVATLAGDVPKIEVGRVVQNGFEVLTRQIGPYLLLSLLLSGIPNGYMNWSTLQAVEGGEASFAYSSPVFWSAWLFAIVGGYLLQAVIVRSSILQLGGAPVDIAGSLINAFRLLLPMIGLAICSWFLVGIGMMLLIVPGIIIYIAFIVSVPVLVEEGGVFHSMRRSRELTRGSRRRIFLMLLLFLVAYLIAWTVTSAISTAFGVDDSAAAQSLLQGASAALMTVLGSAMAASLYFELRSVKEGATVQGLADVFA
jgi:hypothetical protein